MSNRNGGKGRRLLLWFYACQILDGRRASAPKTPDCHSGKEARSSTKRLYGFGPQRRSLSERGMASIRPSELPNKRGRVS
jgi:hypothetical protein